MITKRGFLAGAAAAAAAGAAPTSLGWGRGHARPFDLVVFNERYGDARAFARALGSQGGAAFAIAGDAGTLWYRTLAQHVAAGARRVAGMSTPTDLFILETLAREAAGLRARFVVHHDCRGGSTLTHSIYADGRGRQVERAIRTAGAQWPVALAAVLPYAADPAARPQAAGLVVGLAADIRLATPVERAADHPGLLVSWILDGNRVADSQLKRDHQ